MPEIPPDAILAFVRGLMEIPAVKAMAEVDEWGKEVGLDSDKRAAVVRAVSALLASTTNVDAVKEYIRRTTDAIASLGPGVLQGLDGAGL